MKTLSMDSQLAFNEEDFLACCGSKQFAEQMALASPFASLEQAINAARDIWFNRVNVSGWLEAFSAHPQIGDKPRSSAHDNNMCAEWSKGEQSAAMATASGSSLQELSEWNARYRQKFGFVFLISASGRSTAEILAELKKRYQNRSIVEFEIAAEEQMKITELRLRKLFAGEGKTVMRDQQHVSSTKKAEDRVSVIGAHLTAASQSPTPARTRPPITTHVLDVSRGSPAAGIEVRLETWKGTQPRPTFDETDTNGWSIIGCSTTDKDGRSGQLMDIVNHLNPGTYRISFNTGKYNPAGFFPYVSIVFEVRESQKLEHFHVPLLLAPFSFSTYRGS